MAKKVKKSELGKGIGALLSSFDNNLNTPPPQEIVKDLSNAVANISLDYIEVNPYQPRKEFDEKSLKELSESLKVCLLYTSPSPRDRTRSRMPSSA